MVEPLKMDYAVNDAEVIAAFKRQQNELEKERKARVDLQKQINENAAAQKAADKSATETAKAFAAEQAKLAAAASKIAESVRTPLQAYKVGLAELVDHYKSGRLTQEQYLAAGDKLKEQYRDQAGITAKLEKAEKDKNEEIKSAQRIIESNLTAQQKYERNIAQITDLHKKGRLTLEQYNTAVAAEKTSLDKSAESGDKFGGTLGGLGTKIAGAVAGFTSMGTVITFLKTEYDALLERQGKSADANISLAAEQEALLGNLGDANAGELFASIRKTSKRSGIKEENVTRAVNEAMAARGDLALGDVLSGVETAAKVRKFAPNELAGLSAAAIDTKKQTGLDMDQSMGFLMQMLPQSRVKSLKGVAENFTPAVGGLMQQGADRQTAAALLATLSHGMGDVTGERSRTAGLSLGGQLREYAPGQSMAATIAELQRDKEKRDKFLSTATFEVAARPAIESLLSGGQQARQFAAARNAFNEDPRMALERGIAARSASGSISVAEKDLALGNIVDQQRLMDTTGAASSVNRERLMEIRRQAGQFGITGNLQSVTEDVLSGGSRTSQQTIGALDFEISRLQSGMTDTGIVKENLLAAATGGISLFSASDRMKGSAQSQETKDLIALLTEMRDLAKQQLDEQKEKKLVGAAVGRAKNQNEGGL